MKSTSTANFSDEDEDSKDEQNKIPIKHRIIKAHTSDFKNVDLSIKKKGKLFSDLKMRKPLKITIFNSPNDQAEQDLSQLLSQYSFQDSKSSGWCYGVCINKGSYRKANQDRYAIITPITGDEYGIMAGVFDGFISDNCSQILSETVIHELNQSIATPSNLKEKTFVQLKNTFEAVTKKMEKENKIGGSTSIISIIMKKQLIVANIGDSFCCIIKKDKAVLLNNLHNTKNVNENETIMNKGGYIFKAGGIPRVQGELSVTRAVGNFKLNSLISHEPEIEQINLDEDDEFLILGSDGIINILSVSDLFFLFKAHNNESEIFLAELLVKAALEKGSTDNLTTIVIDLRKILTKSVTEPKINIVFD